MDQAVDILFYLFVYSIITLFVAVVLSILGAPLGRAYLVSFFTTPVGALVYAVVLLVKGRRG